MHKKNIILGIDPGSQLMGYALLAVQNNQPALITMDILSLTKYDDIYERLEKIHTKICSLISTYKPHSFAIEAPFFGKNIQSMLKLGRAQGVAIAAAMQYKIPVTEYSPKKVKQSITGNGNADKEQVWKMLQQILHIETKPKYFDASDALSVALCHYYQTNSILGQTQKGFKNWADYIQQQEKKKKTQ
ncbi:MAG: crossover junction endodeoxyribonuclease RuvC [Sphingobacteriales bacterium]|uniref:crossover junction endodeoxyribonuclease RuvC n=1 Tax=Hydrotalea flava TaxID=714549 RepID=UPI00082A77F3|nr:crossover junction endodeoxyribonuclease RuvC [Hydrotalea flava]RTL50511.1 MAG: crossover junction endodeoxyribonuclease RuvC [Sphingobacteriales bacterium]